MSGRRIRFERSGLRCFLIERNLGTGRFWCGYVEIPDGFPEVDAEMVLDVHGGITFGGKIEDVECLGFDCHHAGDATLGGDPEFAHPGDVYRDQDFVIAECERLATQMLALSRGVMV